uniref:Uncharacterized protein n=1 Tax=Arundo donax TaxID=35708 RepID=A0A0A9B3I8_ARUDO
MHLTDHLYLVQVVTISTVCCLTNKQILHNTQLTRYK